MADPTISDVSELSKSGWTNLSDTQKQALLDDAIREADTIYTERVSTLPTLNGDREVFIKCLAAHHFTMAEGGESGSESSTGGSTSYNHPQGNVYESLSETRFGRRAMSHLRDQNSIGVVTNRR